MNSYWIGNIGSLDVGIQEPVLQNQTAINTAIQLIQKLKSGEIAKNEYETRMHALRDNVDLPETVFTESTLVAKPYEFKENETEEICVEVGKLLNDLNVRAANAVRAYIINKILINGYKEADYRVYIRQLAIDIQDEEFKRRGVGQETRSRIVNELKRLGYIS